MRNRNEVLAYIKTLDDNELEQYRGTFEYGLARFYKEEIEALEGEPLTQVEKDQALQLIKSTYDDDKYPRYRPRELDLSDQYKVARYNREIDIGHWNICEKSDQCDYCIDGDGAGSRRCRVTSVEFFDFEWPDRSESVIMEWGRRWADNSGSHVEHVIRIKDSKYGDTSVIEGKKTWDFISKVFESESPYNRKYYYHFEDFSMPEFVLSEEQCLAIKRRRAEKALSKIKK